MPVPVASVRGTKLKEDINPDIILGNTYHLYLRPQMEILEKAGGL
jgi:queuine tRNA-ribosyltransferase